MDERKPVDTRQMPLPEMAKQPVAPMSVPAADYANPSILGYWIGQLDKILNLPVPIYHLIEDGRSQLSWRWVILQSWKFIAILLVTVLAYFLVSHFIFQSLKVSGYSMYPNLLNNGNYWVNRCVYWDQNPQRADIVEARDPQDGGLLVKRIIALPGESIYFKKGVVYVNGQRLAEPYLPPYTATFAYERSEDEMVCCSTNQYYVLGDNRGNSTDSRTFGPISRQDILGKVIK